MKNNYKCLKSRRVRSRIRNKILAKFGSLQECAKALEASGQYANCFAAYSALCSLTSQAQGLRYHNATLADHLRDRVLAN